MHQRALLAALLAVWATIAMAQLVLAAGGKTIYLPLVRRPIATALPQPTPTSTATTTPTRTATTTPTSTATTVPAPQCVPIMPIGVPGSVLNDGNFVDPGMNGEFGLIDGRTYRRLYFEQSQQLFFLRWQAALGSDQDLALSLSGDGNIEDGFEEVPEWPATSIPAPEVYPELPGQLNAGDWLYTVSPTGEPDEPISVLITTKRLIDLPVYDTILGSGNTILTRIVGLQQFRIREYGKEPGKGSYLTLVAYGEPSGTTCGSPQLDLIGKGWNRPHSGERADYLSHNQPVG